MMRLLLAIFNLTDSHTFFLAVIGCAIDGRKLCFIVSERLSFWFNILSISKQEYKLNVKSKKI